MNTRICFTVIAAAITSGLVLTADASARYRKPDKIDKSRPFEIELKFPQGRSYFVESVANMTQKINMGGQAMNQTIESTTCFMESVEKATKRGATLKLEIDRTAMQMNVMPFGAMRYDSDAPGDDDAPFIRQIFETMLHKPMSMDVSRGGKVTSFTGMEAIKTAISQKSGGNPLWMQMQNRFGDEAAKLEYGESRFEFVPNKPVSIGDAWTVERSNQLPGVGGTISKTEFKLADVKIVEFEGHDRRAAIITYTTTIRPNPDAPKPAAVGGMPAPQIESGTRTGTITFDFKRGLPIRNERESTLRITMGGGPMGNMAVEVESTETTIAMSRPAREKQRAENGQSPKASDDEGDALKGDGDGKPIGG